MADINWGIQNWLGFWGLHTSGTGAVGQDIGAIGTDRVLKAVSVYVRFISGSPSSVPRVAVYQGGVLDNPTGATLLHDAGNFPAVMGWQTVVISGGPLIAQNTMTWIVVKDTSVNNTIYGSMSPPSAWEDFIGVAGARDNIGIVSNPALPFESSIPGAGTLHSPATSCICCYLTHAKAPLPLYLDRIKFLAEK